MKVCWNKIPENPYARTKFIVEEMLDKKVKKNTRFKSCNIKGTLIQLALTNLVLLVINILVLKNGNLVPSILKF